MNLTSLVAEYDAEYAVHQLDQLCADGEAESAAAELPGSGGLRAAPKVWNRWRWPWSGIPTPAVATQQPRDFGVEVGGQFVLSSMPAARERSSTNVS
jgi:hypothetical protein